MKGYTVTILGLACCGIAAATELTVVPEAAVAELGITTGVPQMNGFVFIDGCYLPPPYTVTRKGTALFINRILFEQPVPWSVFVTQAAGAEPVAQKKAVDANGDFQEVTAAAAEKLAVVEKPTVAEKPKAVKSIDDLFADDTPHAAEAKAPVAAVEQPSVTVPTQAAVAIVPAQTVAVQRLPEEIKQKKDELKVGLDNLRKNYEQSLAQGEFYFFSQKHSRLNGNYGTARALIGVLPKALRESSSPQELMQKLKQGGIYFVDQGVCMDLFRNKNTFLLLADRLKKIEENEAFETQRRNGARY